MINNKLNVTGVVRELKGRMQWTRSRLERVPRVWNYVVMVLLATAVLHLADRSENGGVIDAAKASGGFQQAGGGDGLLLKVSGLEIDAGANALLVGRRASPVSGAVSAELLVRTRVVRGAGSGEVRIDARLVNTEDGFLLWSQEYQGSVDEMDELCQEIRRALWEGMGVKLPTHSEGESI